MRTLILTLAVVLLAAPALADVEITLSKDGRVVTIGYDATGETELVRALALDVIATGGNIIAIDDFAIGDDNGGHGIFPGSFAGNISVNPTTGQVDSWVGNPNPYTPVAPAGDPDALGDIPGPAITIEMGSLYETNGPGQTGVLCTVTVDDDVSELCVTGNAIRGNVVLEDASEAALNPLEVCITFDCFPSSDPERYADWVAYEKPDCWCYARQCYGDADGRRQGNDFFGWTYVSTDDLAILIDAWQILEPPKAVEPHPNGILDVAGAICADFDHNRQGNDFFGWMRVSTDDLGVLINAWQALEPPKNDPAHPYFPDGIPGDCVPVPVEP